VELVFLARSLLRGTRVGLLREKNGLDVGEHAALRDGDAREELVQLFIVPKKEQFNEALYRPVGRNMWLFDCFNFS
jgi:hypothetical protein